MAIKKLPKPNSKLHLNDSGYYIHKKSSIRKSALKRASKKSSMLAVLKRLNLIRNITKKNTSNKKKLSQDVEFMEKQYKKEKKKAN
jgi:hypothetical protein